MLAPICAALALALAAPSNSGARARPRVAARASPHASRDSHAGSRLDRARALLASVKRDPAKRRYRHHWERAIAALERAATGPSRGPALLDAARARYALYRYSQVDADREQALRLAARADRAGAKEAAALARAIRKEMGEPDGGRAVAARGKANAKAKATSTPSANPNPAPNPNANPNPPATGDHATSGDEEDASDDPEIEHALGDPSDDAAPPAAPGPAKVVDVKTWSNSDYTRIAVYLSKAVPFTREDVPADGKHPRRLALDLAPATLDQGLARAVDDALVQRVRAAQRDASTVRVVLDLSGEEDLKVFSLDDPPRLIVDVGVLEARRAAQATALAEGEMAPRRPVRRVVIDAGHGGHDTGAIGPTRVREKDVTLAMAKRLARKLEAKGYEVVLTRSGDTFVPLEERTAIANARHGDLFVSLHANAHPRRDRGGVETYVLNVADGRYARRLAARENGALSDDGEAADVRRILADLDAQSSVDASRRLAAGVQRELCAGIRGHVGEVRDLGVKSALFYVLLGARMPAVLVETSFISNRLEERRLASARFQEEVASSISRAVERFASREARLATR